MAEDTTYDTPDGRLVEGRIALTCAKSTGGELGLHFANAAVVSRYIVFYEGIQTRSGDVIISSKNSVV